jgi:hypothetical protein
MPLVRIYPLSKLGSFYLLPNNNTWTLDVETFALSHVGQKYSQWQAVKAFFGISSPDDGLAQCAELVRGILQAQGEDITVNATPSEIVQYMLTKGNTLTYIKGDE